MMKLSQSFLTVHEPGCPVRVFSIHERGVAIGRDPANGIVLGDERVADRHLEILPQSGHYYVVDKQSSEGTWLNDRQAREPTYLRDGDRIRAGRTLMVYGLGRPADIKRPLFAPINAPYFRGLDGLLRSMSPGWPTALSLFAGALFLVAPALPWVKVPLLGQMPTPSEAVVLSLIAGMATIALTLMGDRGGGRQVIGVASAVGILLFCLTMGARSRDLIGIDVVGFGSGVVAVAMGAVLVLVAGRAERLSR